MNAKTRLVIAVAIPVVVMALWILRLSLLSTNPAVRLKIEGFDPRDLLSGHFLVYTVNYGTLPDCSASGQMCLCLDGVTDGLATLTASAPTCEELDRCRNKLAGVCDHGRFTAGIERFYFTETGKKDLAVVPPKSSIDVALDPKGRGVVRELFVDNVPVREWLKTLKETKQ